MDLVDLEDLCLNIVFATLNMGIFSPLCRMELLYLPPRAVLRVNGENGEKNTQMCFILCVLSSVLCCFLHVLSYFGFCVIHFHKVEF